MEYGVPLDAVPEALSRIEALVKTLPVKPMFPIEVRCSAADDIPLSTGNDRASGWIAVHQYIGVPYEAYFQGVEQIMTPDGRTGVSCTIRLPRRSLTVFLSGTHSRSCDAN
jgi:L-gulonolactone oxidase